MSKKLFFVFLTLISFLYLFLRFYHLNTLIGFHLDQSVHLIESKSTIESPKIRLLGPSTSKTFEGRSFFVGSNYYYLLGAVGKISHWDPILITSFFIIFEFIFYLFFIFFIKRKFNPSWSLLTFLAIALSPYLVAHSRFFWNPHILIPLSIIVLFCLDKFIQNKKNIFLIIASFCWGFAFSCHYTPIFWAPIFLYVLVKTKTIFKIKSWAYLISFVVIGDLPFFIFELRHQFYNIKTFVYVFSHSPQSGGLTSHYFVFSLLIFVLFVLLSFFKKLKNKLIVNICFLVIFILTLLIQLKFLPNYASLGVIDGWNYPEQQRVTDIIIKNGCPKDFNVAATMQGDTRFYDLRYLLSLKGCNPMSVDAYPQAQKLFLVAPVSRPSETETVWEVVSFKPFVVAQKIPINDQLIFYELDKSTK